MTCSPATDGIRRSVVCQTNLGAEGYILTVRSPWHAYQKDRVSNAGEWTDGKKPNWSNIRWRTSEMALILRRQEVKSHQKLFAFGGKNRLLILPKRGAI